MRVRAYMNEYTSKETVEEILKQTVLEEMIHITPEEYDHATTFFELGVDSLDKVEIVIALEEKFEIEIADDDAERIGDKEAAVKYLYNRLNHKD